MHAFAPALLPQDLYAPAVLTPAVPAFQEYLRHQLCRLRVPQRSTSRLLEVLVRLFAQNAGRSPTGALWAKPSQRALGRMVWHRWGEQRKPLDRSTVNRLVRRLTALGVLRSTRRGRVGDREHPAGWRLSNLVEPGPWTWQVWRRWCVLAATRLRGFRHNALAPTYRKVLAWASRHLNGVRSFARDCASPSGDATGTPRGEGPTGPLSPRGRDPDPPPPAAREVLQEVQRIFTTRDWW